MSGKEEYIGNDGSRFDSVWDLIEHEKAQELLRDMQRQHQRLAEHAEQHVGEKVEVKNGNRRRTH